MSKVRVAEITAALLAIASSNVLSSSSASTDESPYQFRLESPPGSFRCGAVLISASIALTNASCASPIDPTSVKLVREKINGTHTNSTRESWDIKEIVLHDKFNLNTLENDIAIVVSNSYLQTSNESDFAPIPNETTVLNGEVVFISWIEHKMLSKNSSEFARRTTKVFIAAIEDCLHKTNITTVTKRQLCVESNETETFQSDYAGYLTCSGIERENYLCGILACGNSCKNRSSAVFTKVSAYNQWIQEKISNYSFGNWSNAFTNKSGTVAPPGCAAKEVQCNITKRCIPSSYVCDGEVDDCTYNSLIDKSDEEGCRAVNGCHWSQFACRKGNKCLQGDQRCDGTYDCLDSSDEEGCHNLSAAKNCSLKEFRCNVTKGRIPQEHLCDGIRNCGEGDDSDEETCRQVHGCHPSQFACRKGNVCLPAHQRCDGTRNCGDTSDEANCAWSEANNCTALQLPCNKTAKCYEFKDICNNINDCGTNDSTDESNCTKGVNGCLWTEFPCRVKTQCISGHKRCFGGAECQDGSDEENCNGEDRCHWTQFPCKHSKMCIHNLHRCDGEAQCPDGSDEENCNGTTRCHWSQFTCKRSVECIAGHFVCDGTPQCKDESDEEDCEDPNGPITGAKLATYLAIPSGLVLLLGLVLIALYRKYRLQSNQLSEMEIRLFEKGDESQLMNDKFAHENAQYIPYNKEYETKWKDFQISDADKLGEGAYGVVFKGSLAADPANTVAVKTVKGKVEKSILLALLSELKVMIHLGKHENIVELVGACTEFLRDGRAYVLVEYCPMGSLESYLRKMDQESCRDSCLNLEDGNEKDLEEGKEEKGCEVDSNSLSTSDMVTWAIQIASGMQYLQNKKAIHGDLATRNILLCSEDRLKITDFGLSRQLLNYDNFVKKTQAMLPWRWLALETLKSMVFTHKSDVWAYRVTLWEIFSLGMVRYPRIGWTADFVDFLEHNQRLSKPKYASDEMYRVMMHCWHSDPNRRPDFKQIEGMLRSISGSKAPDLDYVTIGMV